MNPKLKECLKWIAAIVIIMVVFRFIGVFVELHYTGTYRPLW